MSPRPDLRARLAQEPTYGTWCIVPSPELIHVLATSALDFLLVDQEHGVGDVGLLQQCVFAAHDGGSDVIVRLQDASPVGIARALDTGADGVLVPHVESAAQVRELVAAACFPPLGQRSFSPYTPAFRYAPGPDVTARQNERVALGALIESRAGVAALDAICAEPRLDFIYLGAYDLSVELGVPGAIDHPTLVPLLQEASAVARRHGKAVAGIFHGEAQLDQLAKLDASMRVYSVDTAVIRRAYDAVDAWRTTR